MLGFSKLILGIILSQKLITFLLDLLFMLKSSFFMIFIYIFIFIHTPKMNFIAAFFY